MLDEHRGAFEYDWRARFHLPVSCIGVEMSYGETWRLVEIVSADPSSHLAAALAGWSHPTERLALVLMDLYDLQHASKAKRKPKPYPRPWPSLTKRRTKPDAAVSQDDVIAALRAAGHTALLPGEAAGPEPQPRDAQGRFAAKVSG